MRQKYIIHEINNSSNGKYNVKYGFEIGNNELIDNIKTSLYRVDNIDKPIKAFSSYKTQELIDICSKKEGIVETSDERFTLR